ncbi:unnamed protein product [Rotaria sp. Silwood2]|nr:unnamed protein product [Rotaria sp. Silwood2]CAF4593991.1 unnamed protein product [Rotaria sp. Silwood2]
MLILDLESKHRTSLTDEQINLLLTNSTRITDFQQRSSFLNHIGSSTGQYSPSSITSTTTQLSPSTTYNRNQQSIIASVSYKPQLTTTTSMPQNVIEKTI